MGDRVIWQQLAVFGIVGASVAYLVRSLFKGDAGKGCKGCPKG